MTGCDLDHAIARQQLMTINNGVRIERYTQIYVNVYICNRVTTTSSGRRIFLVWPPKKVVGALP